MKPFFRAQVSLCIVALLTLGAAPAADKTGAKSAAPAASDVEHMTDLQVRMMPFGKIFDTLAAGNPDWPMQDKPGAVTPKQLGCLREELSTRGYRRYKQAQVEAYIAANPSKVEAEIALLDRGAADLFGRLVAAGAESEHSGVAADPSVVLKDASPEQMMSFVTFFNDPNYAELRKLSGLGDALSMQKSAEENEAAGEQVGSTLTMQIMLTAMSTCDVPTKVLFGE